jgi:hypothetical protein
VTQPKPALRTCAQTLYGLTGVFPVSLGNTHASPLVRATAAAILRWLLAAHRLAPLASRCGASWVCRDRRDTPVESHGPSWRQGLPTSERKFPTALIPPRMANLATSLAHTAKGTSQTPPLDEIHADGQPERAYKAGKQPNPSATSPKQNGPRQLPSLGLAVRLPVVLPVGVVIVDPAHTAEADRALCPAPRSFRANRSRH